MAASLSPGKFTMGSPAGEKDRSDNRAQLLGVVVTTSTVRVRRNHSVYAPTGVSRPPHPAPKHQCCRTLFQ
jgi:hypothetical protein